MIRGCTAKNVHATGLPDHLLFDHYQDFLADLSSIAAPILKIFRRNCQRAHIAKR